MSPVGPVSERLRVRLMAALLPGVREKRPGAIVTCVDRDTGREFEHCDAHPVFTERCQACEDAEVEHREKRA